jgi:pyruvate dehydrogenase E2 component (dihydrolipoamide acetyltransferase)
MAVGVLMPKAGISVESCIIGTWAFKPGDSVKKGDILFEYETDKATFECEATEEGTLLEIFFENGDEVPVLTNVCAIGTPGEDTTHLNPSKGTVSDKQEVKAEPNVNAAPVETTSSGTDKKAISPRAKNLAERLKIDSNAVTPTGPRGRIIERDVQKAANDGTALGGRSNNLVKPSTKPTDQEASAYTDEKLSSVRKAISKAMDKSLSEIPQVTNHNSCDATNMLALRRRFKDSKSELENISINDMVMFALSRTLLVHADLNAHLLENDTLRRFSGVHLGMAVDTPRGLLVPTIFNADKMSLLQLSTAIKDVALQARDGSISPDLLQGASFTVTNLGTLGVEMFTPVINPPQVAILGICNITPKIKNIEAEVYQSLGLSLTYDHRVVDGAPAARFAYDLARNIENIDLTLAI